VLLLPHPPAHSPASSAWQQQQQRQQKQHESEAHRKLLLFHDRLFSPCLQAKLAKSSFSFTQKLLQQLS
jgi:hypothetical protein